jgi:glutamine synthetase
MSSKDVLEAISNNEIEFVDLRFTDTKGKEQHVTVPAEQVDADFLENGKTFDGSSIAGWKGINDSDMILKLDFTTAVVDPFAQANQLNIRCDIIDPNDMGGYNRDPRSIAKRAENYLKSTGIADSCFIGPEPEFFVFDDVRWDSNVNGCFAEVNSVEAAWSSKSKIKEGNLGHRPGVKGGYFPVPPVDSLSDFRGEICQLITEMGLIPEVHHHEVATAGQCEIGVAGNTLVKKADEVQIFKYVVHNVANLYGKTATFMPKPLVGDNGSGMHINISLSNKGKNIFDGSQYANLSEEALFFIGGMLKHSRVLNAFTNPGTNSYKRLVPGFEAPVMLAYSARNRSASVRIPLAMSPKARRVELRFPDPSANPYLAFSAVLMAGIDGIKNKIHPGDPSDKDLYDLPPEEEANFPTVCASLEEALESLRSDYAFLLEGDVFSKDMLDGYIELKMEEVQRMRATTHPIEFDMYYSV